jgi:polyketide cyclase/dehydrase/lipid transport protein
MPVTNNSILIHKPIAAVFEYATTPGNWPKYHPNSLGVSGVTDRPVLVGDVTREHALLMGREGEGAWRVVGRDAPHMVKWTISNPGFKASLLYAFERKPGGTQFTRILAYNTPDLPDAVRARFEQFMADESEKAVQNLKRVLEEPAV